MTTILLARHGQASFGQANYDQLSKLGIKQARLLGKHYASTQRRIDAVYSGSLVRQQDSARHFWEVYQASAADRESSAFDISTPEQHVLPLFNEFNHKDVFLKSDPAFASPADIAAKIAQAENPNLRLAELFDNAMQRWHSGNYDEDYIESWLQFNSRAQQALEQLIERIETLGHLEKGSTVLVFTSGGVIAAITAKLLEQDSKGSYQINKSLVNTGVTAITLPKQTPRLLSMNEYSHLFADGESFVTWR
ncbi:histidine phosphatase family protein [Psychrobacter jeotgali]|uniref:histidine phosphatase family protein n=1 Tax=Psychrobacter jeotgali TaxID=179010 RepID=UPI001919FCF0|nr:histidine phosphatase family protein [Psychrobacter jeotgali]